MKQVTINQEIIEQIKTENEKFGYTASNYEIAADYIRLSDERLNLVYGLIGGYKSNKTALQMIQMATKELAKQL